MVSKQGIKSVYEAEEQSIHRGGKGDSLAASKRKDIPPNTDLQHFLLKNKASKENDSLRISGFSHRKSAENSVSHERNRYGRNSLKQGIKTHQSIDSAATMPNAAGVTKEAQRTGFTEESTSPLAAPMTQKSSLGINITQIGQAKEQKKRPPSRTNKGKHADKPATSVALQAHQKKAHEAVEAARVLINNARIMKLDPEMISQ